MTWQLRRANALDLDGIMQLETSIFGTDAWSSAVMLEELRSNNCWYVVAFRPESPQQLDAYAGLQAPRGAKDAEIQTIAVTEQARRSGLGRTIMQTLLGEAGKRGAEDVFLEVRADNPSAQRLYLSLGFEQIAIRPKYYQPDGVDAVVMRASIPKRRPTLAGEK